MFVKICGITTEKDALLAIALGADALGFVFAPGSPRMVTVDEATDIVKHVPYDEVLTLGVFRDERPERVAEIVNRVGLQRRAASRSRVGGRGRVRPAARPARRAGFRRRRPGDLDGFGRSRRRRAHRCARPGLGPRVRLGADRRRTRTAFV